MRDRQVLILGALKCGLKKSADLVAITQMSERTVYRDIAELKRAGYPICGEAGVGYIMRPIREERRHG